MPYLTLTVTSTQLSEVAPDAVAAWKALGWVDATDEDVLAWKAADIYGGTQGLPAAPPLPLPVVADAEPEPTPDPEPDPAPVEPITEPAPVVETPAPDQAPVPEPTPPSV